LTILVYEAQYSHLLEVEVLNSTFAFVFNVSKDIKQQIRHNIKRIITLYSQQQIFEFTGQHYAGVAEFLMSFPKFYPYIDFKRWALSIRPFYFLY